jgi:arabinofuranosyltransferase
MGWTYRWVADDAFVDLRVAENLMRGYGPLYNVGERVEGYSNPLWVLLLAIVGKPFELLGSGRAPLEWIAVFLCLALAFVGVTAGMLGARRLWRAAGETGPIFAVGGFAVVVLMPFWDFATSGLEIGLSLSWLGVSFFLLASQIQKIDRKVPRAIAVFLGLGPLVRPDLALYTLCFLAAEQWLVRRRRWEAWLPVLFWAALVPVAYQIFRMGYFAALVPNTAIAKEAGVSRWDQGWIYLRDFADPYLLWVPAALLLETYVLDLKRLSAERRWDVAAVVVAPVVAALLQVVFVTRVGGDFMHGRMLLPAFFALTLPVACVSLRRHWAFAALLALWVVPTIWLRVPYLGRDATTGEAGFAPRNIGIAEERAVYADVSHNPNPVTLTDFQHWDRIPDGRWLHRLATRRMQPGRAFFARGRGDVREVTLPVSSWVTTPVVAVRDNVGMVSYAAGADVTIADNMGGLADPIGSRMRLGGRGRPGHEKGQSLEWVLGRYFETLDPDAPERSLVGWDPARLAAAQAAFRCGDLARLRAAVEWPLTWQRFFSNIRWSFRFTAMRIPPDPLEAEREFCGT